MQSVDVVLALAHFSRQSAPAQVDEADEPISTQATQCKLLVLANALRKGNDSQQSCQFCHVTYDSFSSVACGAPVRPEHNLACISTEQKDRYESHLAIPKSQKKYLAATAFLDKNGCISADSF